MHPDHLHRINNPNHLDPLDHPEKPFWVGNGSLSSIARPTDLNVVALADDYNNSVQVDKLNFGQNFDADYFPKKSSFKERKIYDLIRFSS